MAESIMGDNPEINDYLSAVRKLNIDEFIDGLGLQKTSNGCRFDFFNHPILFDHTDFVDLSGKALSISVKIVLCKYLLSRPKPPLEKSARLVTFREFSKDSPLFYSFVENTSKTIEQTFSNRADLLKEKCRQIYGMPVSHASYDLSVRFKALPRIPITLQFNDMDEMLPAKAIFLFHEDAVNYLDLKSLGSMMTYLTGILINAGQTPETAIGKLSGSPSD